MGDGGAASATLVLVGCGKMGTAMLRGWVAAGAASRFLVVEPAGTPAVRLAQAEIDWYPAARRCRRDLAPDAVVFAVKPQIADEVVPGLSPLGAPRHRFRVDQSPARPWRASRAISAVPRSFARCPTRRPRSAAASRSPAPTRCVTRRAAAALRRLLAAIGESAWVEDEALIDAVTAVSGSGPAYVFLLIEALARAGRVRRFARRTGLAAGPRHGSGIGRIGPHLPGKPGPAARKRHKPGRHDPRGARRADGCRRPRAADRACGRRGGGPVARAGELKWRETGRGEGAAATRGSAPSEADRIIDAALALIATEGWRGVSLARSPPRPGFRSCRSIGHFRRNRRSSADFIAGSMRS